MYRWIQSLPENVDNQSISLSAIIIHLHYSNDVNICPAAAQVELHPLQYSSAPTAPRQPAGTVHSMSDHHRRFYFATVHCD
jgi:hypothetical protein